MKIHFQAYKAGLENTLIEIRNHSSVRTFMTDPNEISLNDHLNWVKQNLDPECHYRGQTQLAFIMLNGHPQGFVMVRDIENHCGEIGIMIRDSEAVTGLGAIAGVLALEKLVFGILNLTTIISKTSPQNTKSLTIHRALGGEELERDDPRHIWFTFKADRCRSTKIYQGIMKRYGDQGSLVF
jgi:RimJ/RimL family protein N-acetyltransferase